MGRSTRRNEESHVQTAIMLAWGAHPRVRFARCNTGVAWFGKNPVTGKYTSVRPEDEGAHPVKFNPPGTADLVGLIKPSGRMLMIEVKSPTGTQRDAQETMERVVTSMGGIYIRAHSLADVDAVLVPLVGPR